MLFLIWGRRLYGRVDRVPGVFFVGTVFFHIYYIPLFPLGTFLVMESSGIAANVVPFSFDYGPSFLGVHLPRSLKSILLAWARIVLTPVSILFLMIAPTTRMSIGETITVATIVVVTLALLLLPSRIRPRFERAVSLGEAAGFSEDGWALLYSAYGKTADLTQS